MNRYPQGWLVGHVEKFGPVVSTPLSGSGAFETLATQLANTQEDVLSPNKAKRSEVASSKFERAPRAESLPAPKNFFAKTSFTQRLPPLMGQNHFWTGFCQRGHD